MKIIYNEKINESLNFKNTNTDEINNILNNTDVFVFILVKWCQYCIQFEPTLINFLKIIKNNLKKNILILDGDKINNYHALSNYSGFPGLLYISKGNIIDKFENEKRTVDNLLRLFKNKNIINNLKGGRKKSLRKKSLRKKSFRKKI